MKYLLWCLIIIPTILLENVYAWTIDYTVIDQRDISMFVPDDSGSIPGMYGFINLGGGPGTVEARVDEIGGVDYQRKEAFIKFSLSITSDYGTGGLDLVDLLYDPPISRMYADSWASGPDIQHSVYSNYYEKGSYASTDDNWTDFEKGDILTLQQGMSYTFLFELINEVRVEIHDGAGSVWASSEECAVASGSPSYIILTEDVEAGVPVPEPSTLFLFSVALIGIAGINHKRKIKMI